ncbi:Endonuclease/exonuclease/phosphatase [Ephemerocybe angulata]|uniref:Endonuclease/exonuclease/phosphatase n=1 Tax=Ephemerocybe angulata TaxID=980116 RepID=A0A8H6H8S7_9AGAR|nr:Endonuclease/exonuclease/phosphatase [Tulosesus angulatus]
MASLNLRGAGSGRSRTKWKDVNDIVRQKGLSLLAVQETHLTDEYLDILKMRYKYLEIVSSPDPDNASGKGGVAIILNRSNTCWQEITTEVIVPGRALGVTVRWGHASKLKVVAIYAPSGNHVENANFWTALKERWDGTPEDRPDVLLGDLNMVESGIDRLPANTDPEMVVGAFRDLKESCSLIDGWMATHMTEKPQYTYRTMRRDAANARSRIDRIYLRENLFDLSYEWTIVDSGIERLNHYLITAYVATSVT